MDDTRHVRINREVVLYDEKAPYQQSGESVSGAIEYSVKDDKLKCHECGKWFGHLANHVRHGHGIDPREYRIKHGLRFKTALVNENFRQVRAKAAKRVWEGLSNAQKQAFLHHPFKTAPKNGMNRNKFGQRSVVADQNASKTCRLQILERIRNASDAMGVKSPSMMQLAEYGVPYYPLLFHFGGLENALAEAGLVSHGKGAWHYSDESLIEALKTFYFTHQRLPYASDHRRGLLPSQQTYTRRFGGRQEAYDTAFRDICPNWRVVNLEQWKTARRESAA